MSRYSKILWTAIITLLISSPPMQVQACDVCALFSGATPNVLKNRVGVFFRYRSFSGLYDGVSFGKNRVEHYPGGFPQPTSENPVRIQEHYATSILYGRWFFQPRWNVQLQVPTVYNAATVGDFKQAIGGLGDINAMVSHTLIDQSEEDKAFQLFLGAGVKLPTGTRFSEITDYLEWFELQGTSGSIDGLIRLDASWRKNKWGLLASNLFRLNTPDKHEIRFGNFLNVSANAFYIKDMAQGRFQLMPTGGFFLEHYAGRSIYGDAIPDTGGTTLFATAGATFFLNAFALRSELQVPVVQQLNGVQMLSRSAITVDISYNF